MKVKKKNFQKKGGVMLILSLFGIFNTQEFLMGCTREESM